MLLIHKKPKFKKIRYRAKFPVPALPEIWASAGQVQVLVQVGNTLNTVGRVPGTCNPVSVL